MKTYLTGLLAVFLTLGGLAMGTAEDGFAAQGDKTRTIVMTGRASVGAAPDRVMINLGVVSKAPTARDALSLNTANMKKIIETVKQNGVKRKHIQTSNFSIQPEYKHFKNGEPPQVRRYSVNNTVRIVVTEIDKLGELLDKVVSSGSNQIQGIQFFVSNEDKLKDEARKLAVKAAQRKASLYAKAAGVELGDVINISESSHRGGRPVPMARTMVAEAAVPIEGGEQQLEVAVTISWEID